ncbi:hypothetical protein Ga0100231_008580 [Opitutaceae bacterium TAV4]|nr:hypothetical protein Ga0100231_008580 [Opitutaceae bacterium TAV4]RRJ98495.1 hypothetical protein Ga0100230_008865 [Opitutaceae bacterium TAV3]
MNKKPLPSTPPSPVLSAPRSTPFATPEPIPPATSPAASCTRRTFLRIGATASLLLAANAKNPARAAADTAPLPPSTPSTARLRKRSLETAIRLEYPKKDATPENTFTRDTLCMVAAQLMSWRQGAGAFGQLHLHASWGIARSLERRYHGQTISRYQRILAGVLQLHRHSGDPRWQLLADDIAAAILYLQTPEGGFYHASSEAEPTYSSRQSTTIHQATPILTLLDYAVWPGANPLRVAQIKTAIEKWWSWFEPFWWQHGNRWTRRNNIKRDWFCGVTNQDLVVAAALARLASVFGNKIPWETRGKPCLDVFLGKDYYHPETGLFERGDRSDYVEHSSYYDIIIPMLETIRDATGDPRLQAVIDNASNYLFNALTAGEDNFTHIARKAILDKKDLTKISGWNRAPFAFSSYPLLIKIMRAHLRRHPNGQKETACREVEKTLAAYLYADGTIPVSLSQHPDPAKREPLFVIAGHPNYNTLFAFLTDRLGDKANITMDDLPELPCVMRTCGNATWLSNRQAWAFEREGRREYAGVKCESSAVAIGPDEKLWGIRPDALDTPQIQETVSFWG